MKPELHHGEIRNQSIQILRLFHSQSESVTRDESGTIHAFQGGSRARQSEHRKLETQLLQSIGTIHHVRVREDGLIRRYTGLLRIESMNESDTHRNGYGSAEGQTNG
jgi:hypothetical protein